MTVPRRYLLLTALSAGLICFVIYLGALSCDFINFDDPQYVIENTGIRSMGKDFWNWSLLTIPLNYWTPLLWISFALDYHFWGLNPLGYHLTNILLHALNVSLFVLFAHRIYAQRSSGEGGVNGTLLYAATLLLAGLLFGAHPARVESVVWITERKDVLNGVFTLGFLLFYMRYLQDKGDSGRGGRVDYGLALLLFVFSMLIKPSGFLLPFALLVMDWYPLGRFSREKAWPLLREKVPFLISGAVIVAISIIFRLKQGGFNSLTDFPMAVRTVAAGNSLIEYCLLMLFPVNILPYEILPRGVPVVYIYKAIAAGLILVFTAVFARRFPAWSASVLFFVITILPSLHFLTDGYQNVLCPRYTYLPSILSCILAAPAIIAVGRRIAAAAGRYGAGIALFLVASLLVFYAITTVILINDWKNSGVFWTKVIETRPFDKAYYFRGMYQAEQGDYPAAVKDYSTCIELASQLTFPAIHNVYAYRGYSLLKEGYYQDAVDDFTTSIFLYPHQLYYYHRGVALKSLGRLNEAAADFARAGTSREGLVWLEGPNR